MLVQSFLDLLKIVSLGAILFGGAILEYNSSINFLTTISILLLLAIVYLNWRLDSFRLLSPLLVFSVMYFGYVVGGLYYAQSNEYYGKFIEFSGLNLVFVQESLIRAQLFVLINFIMFAIGYKFVGGRYGDFARIRCIGVDRFIAKTYMVVAPPLLVIGFVHWIYVSYTLAGGVVDLFKIFHVFPHLAKEHEISTLPYLAFYAGIYYILLGLVANGKRIGPLFWVLSLTGAAMSLSTGRISISVCYLLSQLYFIYLSRPEDRRKIIRILGGLVVVAFLVYFLRDASNYYFLGQDYSLSLDEILPTLIGGGNVCDLQQLVLIFYAFDVRDFLFGATYFDWAVNSFGGLVGLMPASVGLLIADVFVPDTSGAPTPGAIGEAYANFGFGAPIFMLLVGAIFSYIFKAASNSLSALNIFVYSSFLANFVFLYPKVDSTMLSNLFWGTVPLLMVAYPLYWLNLILRKLCISNRHAD